jgi:hypothetical protein
MGTVLSFFRRISALVDAIEFRNFALSEAQHACDPMSCVSGVPFSYQLTLQITLQD